MKRMELGCFLRPAKTPFRRCLKIAAELCAGEQCSHIEGIDHSVFEGVRNFTLMDFECQALGHRCFSNARIADVDRIVLTPSTEDVNRPFDFVVASDQRIDIPLLRFRYQINCKSFQRFDPAGWFFFFSLLLFVLRPFFRGRDLRDPVGDVIHKIEARDSLLL